MLQPRLRLCSTHHFSPMTTRASLVNSDRLLDRDFKQQFARPCSDEIKKYIKEIIYPRLDLQHIKDVAESLFQELHCLTNENYFISVTRDDIEKFLDNFKDFRERCIQLDKQREEKLGKEKLDRQLKQGEEEVGNRARDRSSDSDAEIARQEIQQSMKDVRQHLALVT